MRNSIIILFVFFAAVFAQNGPLAKLPPDPGAAGKKTVLGIDSDGDGVRDDIQIEVTKLIPNDPYARAGAMFWFAMEQERFRAYIENPNESFEFFYQYFLGTMAGTSYSRQTGASDLIPVERRLVILLNTKERFLVNQEIGRIVNGKGVRHYSHYPDIKEMYDKRFKEFYEREKERQK
ncbi:MAG: hypothetical protein LBH98_10615 [Chitinispirillales bacterium]|jgi:hypothetical protein|nr:hypothetical protein [Chitinispirillales bacterium]